MAPLAIATTIFVLAQACLGSTIPNSAVSLPVLSQEMVADGWDLVKPALDYMFPGITCTFNSTDTKAGTVLDKTTQEIENEIKKFYPQAHCYGKLDISAIQKTSNALESNDEGSLSEDVSLWRRDSAPYFFQLPGECPSGHVCTCAAIPIGPRKVNYNPEPLRKLNSNQGNNTPRRLLEEEATSWTTSVKKESSAGYGWCSSAPHPDLCYSCWTGFCVQLVSEVGTCLARARTAWGGNRNWFDQTAFELRCCLGAALGKFVALSSGCPTR
ncbi:hypothetical protein RAB80_014344 [Fusarium oxysporum f. sp. vasinfectum]|nr:hypothetical protein RAB80_014344 [Fusarium oxysporum f. sp. vasinfectum]KAK2931643.1 hypothetical protein FoTM2_009159 [Fusarium oxysporum f. sp. vasinfectum]